MTAYLLLFYEFFKAGLFAIGGGLATLPFIYDMSARYPNWFSVDDISNMIAVSESTPGPIGINMATYTGFTVGGVLGAVISTVGVVLPSLIVIIIVAKFLQKFQDSKLVRHAFYGLRPAVAGLIAAAAFQVVKVAILTLETFMQTHKLLDLVDLRGLIICAVTLVLLYIKPLKKIHPIIYILCGAVVGILVY